MFYALDSLPIALTDVNMHRMNTLVAVPPGSTRFQIQNLGAAAAYVGISSGAVAPAKETCHTLLQFQIITVDQAGGDKIWVGADAVQNMIVTPYIGSAGN